MKKEHKFKIGDVVRHAATTKYDGIKMVVLGVGTMVSSSGTTLIYQVSGQRSPMVEDNIMFGAVLSEEELINAE